ncbi:MAG: alanine/glycine:cation symporter family protein [Bacteroidetes bacterium]|nr:alanine/glycine:cation symporter family protein [Bacteroidota bacterium]MDA1119668.1 alanine/glycine:cation symporter family protein [Bacteroidota bacterium]
MSFVEQLAIDAANFIWGTPLLILLMGGGLFFMVYSRFLPYKYFGHAINILRGKYDDPNDPGEINHFEALSSALAATVGMGNISGVAVAIAMGGPGAVFWMSVSALVGISTKFFTCTLAVMYRGRDSEGNLQGGPMYFITEGLGPKWKPLAIFFCVAGTFGATPLFQANQLIQVVHDAVLYPTGLASPDSLVSNVIVGIVVTIIVAFVIFGGIKRIANVASKLVPSMVLLYSACVLFIMVKYYENVIPSILLILTDAFTADAALGGAVGMIIITGARRAAFSNEAGIGTSPMMHGAVKTDEPVREGLVAMLEPAIDTIIVCTLTALAILVTGVWKDTDSSGITLTSNAFEMAMPGVGSYLLMICVTIFAITTIFGLAYYGRKCFSFLVGAKYGHYFNYWYIMGIIIGSVLSLQAIFSFIDFAYALMSIPTVISAVLLAPRVKKAAEEYFSKIH